MEKDSTNLSTFRAPKTVATEKSLFVEFYVLNPETKKFKRFRTEKGIKGTTKRERLRSARELRDKILEKLSSGWSPLEAPKESGTLREFLREFLSEIESTKKRKTFSSYKSLLLYFLQFLEGEGLSREHPSKVEGVTISKYVRKVKLEKKSPLTVSNYLLKLKLFFNYLKKRGAITNNPAENIELPKGHRKTRLDIITPGELLKVREVLSAKNPGLFLFCSLVYYCFLRPGEITALKVRDINKKASSITVPSSVSKNKKTQTVIIPEGLSSKLKEHVSGANPDEFIFSTSYAPGLVKTHPNRPARNWKELIKEPGVSSADLYSLKHRGAIDALESGVNIRALQLQLRHYSLEITEIYLSSLTGSSQSVFKGFEGNF